MMHNIITYLNEKLHIDKNTKCIETAEVSKYLISLCSLKDNKEASDIINDWVNQNNVELIDIYFHANSKFEEYINKLFRTKEFKPSNFNCANEQHSCSLGNFLKEFHKHFTNKYKKQSEYSVYDDTEMEIFAKNKVLSIFADEFRFIFVKKETI